MRSSSEPSAVVLEKCLQVVLYLLDESINKKNHITRWIGEEVEERTVFITVFDYLHNPTWTCQVDNVSKEDLAIAEGLRGQASVTTQLLEKCERAIEKEVTIIHNLNCELFFTKMEKETLKFEPTYFKFTSSDAFHRAIVDGNFSLGEELPERFKSDLERHSEERRLVAMRTKKNAKVKVYAAIHFIGIPHEYLTFHSKIEK